MKKLDMRGMTHLVMTLGFIVIFAIAGVGYVVASHADATTAVSCAIGNVPATPRYGEVVNPTVTITNNAKKPVTLSPTFSPYVISDSGVSQPAKGALQLAAVSLKGGQTATVATNFNFSVPYSSTNMHQTYYTVTSASPALSCTSTKMTLPAQPVAQTGNVDVQVLTSSSTGGYTMPVSGASVRISVSGLSDCASGNTLLTDATSSPSIAGGVAHFTGCPIAPSTAAPYHVEGVTLTGYAISPSSPVIPGTRSANFDITAGQTTALKVYVDQVKLPPVL